MVAHDHLSTGNCKLKPQRDIQVYYKTTTVAKIRKKQYEEPKKMWSHWNSQSQLLKR